MELTELIQFLKIRALIDGSTNTFKFLDGQINLISYIETQMINQEENIRYFENRIKEEQMELEKELKKEKPYDWQINSNKDNIKRLENNITKTRGKLQNLNDERRKLTEVEH